MSDNAVQDISYPFTSRTAWHREFQFGLDKWSLQAAEYEQDKHQAACVRTRILADIKMFALCSAEGRSQDAVGRVTWHRTTSLLPQHPLEIQPLAAANTTAQVASG